MDLLYTYLLGKMINGGSGGNATWGNITGTLSDQTDLQSELNAKQETLINQTNIKSINGNSILGSGNLAIKTYQSFPNTWTTDSTTIAFCSDINSDTSAITGMAYLGELTCSDLPFVGNADAVVEIMDDGGNVGKVVHIVITSGNTAPYRWEYTYWNNGSNVSGWISYLPLSGGTMTGPISTNWGIKDPDHNRYYMTTVNDGSGMTLGNNNMYVRVFVSSGQNFTVRRGSGTDNIVLDAGNTAANPTLAGTEVQLTGLKINNVSYKVLPSVTTTDEGKFLVVNSSGAWEATTVPNANGQNF